jgi:hypothetical protein
MISEIGKLRIELGGLITNSEEAGLEDTENGADEDLEGVVMNAEAISE